MSRLLPVALLAFCGFFVYIFGLYVKGTQPYDCALAEARRSPRVVAALGEPLEPGFFAWLSHYRQEGSVTDAAFRITLEGPKGKGALRVRWYSTPVGAALYMELEARGRRQVVYNAPPLCR